jgi:hypothetical protein
MNLDTPIDFFVLFIVIIKIFFILTAIGNVILTHVVKKNATAANATATAADKASAAATAAKAANLLYWKERTEFIFTICMAILLIYYFKPGTSKPMNRETGLLFFLFGWILIITAKWNIFFTQAKWYSNISGA